MTLCNRSFSATQFALLSALSAIGRVYVGPIAGWFVEAHGWPLFYLFSVAASVPGILLLLMCKNTLEYTQRTGSFMPRHHYGAVYRLALQILSISCLLLITWLLILISNALDITHWTIGTQLLQWGALLAVVGIVIGGTLDFLALRKVPNPPIEAP